MGSFDAYVEVTPGKLPAPQWHHLACKIASYIFSLGLLPLAALIAKCIYRYRHPISLRETPVIRSFAELPANLLSIILSYHFMPARDSLINKNCAEAARSPLYWKSIFAKLEAIINNGQEMVRFVNRIKKLYTGGGEPTYQQKVHYLCLEMWEDVLQVPEAAKLFCAEGLTIGHFTDPIQYARFKALVQPAKDSNLIYLCRAFGIQIPLSPPSSDTESEPDDNVPEPNAPVEQDLHATDSDSEPNVPDPEVPVEPNIPEPDAPVESPPRVPDSDSESEALEPNSPRKILRAKTVYRELVCGYRSEQQKADLVREWFFSGELPNYQPDFSHFSSQFETSKLVGDPTIPMLSTEMIECLSKISNLKKLSLGNMGLSLIPSAIGLLDTLEVINFRKNNLKTLPETFGNLLQLRNLHLDNNNLQTLPETFGHLRALKSLFLNNNSLTTLPNSFVNLTKLTYFTFKNNKLTNVPEVVKEMMEKINASNDIEIKEINQNFQQKLRDKNIQENEIAEASKSVQVFLDKLYNGF